MICEEVRSRDLSSPPFPFELRRTLLDPVDASDRDGHGHSMRVTRPGVTRYRMTTERDIRRAPDALEDLNANTAEPYASHDRGARTQPAGGGCTDRGECWAWWLGFAGTQCGESTRSRAAR